MGYNPQESLENTINTMGTCTLGVHPSLSLEGTWMSQEVSKWLVNGLEPTYKL